MHVTALLRIQSFLSHSHTHTAEHQPHMGPCVGKDTADAPALRFLGLFGCASEQSCLCVHPLVQFQLKIMRSFVIILALSLLLTT